MQILVCQIAFKTKPLTTTTTTTQAEKYEILKHLMISKDG
tara:strand:+ start:143 stop:262 length:120 start_codon:yes stop_codon:yes gene_type:complete